MKKTSRLLGALLALCLLLSLSAAPALAENVQYTSPAQAESAYREEFAETGGWPPESIGSWVGFYMHTWGCWSFYPDGRHVLTNFDMPSYNMIGTSKNLEPADEVTYETTGEGDLWHLYDNENRGEFRKVSMPWVRLKEEEETAAAGVDPAIVGTFGGKMDEVYVEWTFHGDGRVTRVTPQLELTENGAFLTGVDGGELAILLGGKIIKCEYTARKSSLTFKFPDSHPTLIKRAGPLAQVPEQWRIE
ncbi:MAG: hypothetical protein PHP02_01340 [Eubacteriales bacterium]|nr:hypothetical protein [Eubacteriales bacterium]